MYIIYNLYIHYIYIYIYIYNLYIYYYFIIRFRFAPGFFVEAKAYRDNYP